MFRLRIHLPDREPTEVTVQGNRALIGRVGGEVQIPEKTVSSRHALLLAGVVVADLQSLNGVWVKGERLEEPTLLETPSFTLGGDSESSARIEVLETEVESGEDLAREREDNERLRKQLDIARRDHAELERRVAELQASLQAMQDDAAGAAAHAGSMTMAIDPGEFRAVFDEARGEARPEVPEADPPTAVVHLPQAPAPEPEPSAAGPDEALPSFAEFFSAYQAPASDAPRKPASLAGQAPPKPTAPPIPARPVGGSPGAGGHGNRAAVLGVIDRLIKEDVLERKPVLEGPVEEFFTLESFRLLRQVERVITRLARDFVQLYEMKTMLPSAQGNFRSLAADVLVDPDNQAARRELVEYLDDLCRWLGVSLVANRRSALQYLSDLKVELSPQGLTRDAPIPVWMKAPLLQEGELWRRSQRYLAGLTQTVIEDRLEGLVKEFAQEHMDRR